MGGKILLKDLSSSKVGLSTVVNEKNELSILWEKVLDIEKTSLST